MKKPIDNSGKPIPIKKSKLDPLSDSNESNSIIDGADKFVLFPLDIQETNSISTNPITQNKSTSQEDDFILFPLDINLPANSTNKNTQSASYPSNKGNQNKTKTVPPKPIPPPPNIPKPLPVVFKKTNLYWSVFFGFCAYALVKSEEYYILGIISIALSAWYFISYLYLRAKFSNRSSNLTLIFTFILLAAIGSYFGYNFLSKKNAQQEIIANQNLQKVKSIIAAKFTKFGYYIVNVSELSSFETQYNSNYPYLVTYKNADSISNGKVYEINVSANTEFQTVSDMFGSNNTNGPSGLVETLGDLKDLKNTESIRLAQIKKYFASVEATILYIKPLFTSDTNQGIYSYEIPITFTAMNGYSQIYWIDHIDVNHGDITGGHYKTIDKAEYDRLAKLKKNKKSKKNSNSALKVLKVDKDTSKNQSELDPEAAKVIIPNEGNKVVEHETEVAFTIVEQMPEFIGGERKMKKYIRKTLQYPQVEKEAGIQGTCYVTFVVEKDGSISDVKVLRGVSGCLNCDCEAIRVVKSMPSWKPGMNNGREVRTVYNLPIKFSLSFKELLNY